MRSITFRPLRVLKSGKIAVAGYMQWRKVKCADYSKFGLVVRDEYKSMPPDAQVHNHNGEPLFFPDYRPDEHTGWRDEKHAVGIDCDGVPAFTNYTANDIADHHNVEQFEPLTVGMVTAWWGWFLYRLDNVRFEHITT